MSTFAWYADAGLTIPLTRADFVRGSTLSNVNRVVYFGSPTEGKVLRRQSDPGVDPLQVAIVDANGAAAPAAADVKLASTFAGLDSATPGAPLSIGTVLNSGAVNAVPVFVRFGGSISAPGEYDDLSLQVSDWLESTA